MNKQPEIIPNPLIEVPLIDFSLYDMNIPVGTPLKAWIHSINETGAVQINYNLQAIPVNNITAIDEDVLNIGFE